MNPFFEYHALAEKHPERFSEKILQQIAIQKEMLEKYDFIEEKGALAVKWIETFCILPSGKNAGKPVRLLLWQKWFIYSIFCFWGNIEEEEFDEDGNFLGIKKSYTRIVNDVLLIIASGNAKTTLYSFIICYILFCDDDISAPDIYIGANTKDQAKICLEAVNKTIRNNRILDKRSRIIESRNETKIESRSAKVKAISSDRKGNEGIIPAVIVIDEIHEMPDAVYATNLRKSTKRPDLLILESSTNGIVRGGYLDQRMDLAKKLLDKGTSTRNYRKFFAIYEQESEEEVVQAYENNNMSIYLKSNPSLGYAVTPALLKDKVKEMMVDPSQKPTNLCKNFNIPQNAATCFFSAVECMAKPFNEEIFNGAPIFVGLDVAWTKLPSADLTAITLMIANPHNDERWIKDIYLLPEFYEVQEVKDGVIHSQKFKMAPEKSKYDRNIPYDEVNKIYGYEELAKKGDVVIVDKELLKKLKDKYGKFISLPDECSMITENIIIAYLSYLEAEYRFMICKFGYDPNKAENIATFFNNNYRTRDKMNICIPFEMQRIKISNAVMEKVKMLRNNGEVYCNNKLTEIHFASAQTEETKFGFKLVNPNNTRKDGVISNLAAESAYMAFTANEKSGAKNSAMLKGWWDANESRLRKLLEKDIL